MSFHSCSWVQVPPSQEQWDLQLLWVEFRFHLSSPRFISSTHLACIWDQLRLPVSARLSATSRWAWHYFSGLVMSCANVVFCVSSLPCPPISIHSHRLTDAGLVRHHVTCWTFTCRLLLLLMLVPEIKIGKVGRLESLVLWHSLTHTWWPRPSENSSIR